MFDPYMSDTFIDGIDTCSITFGSGKLEGVFGKDKVQIGDGVSIDDQSLGLTTSQKVFDDSFDCIIGLAYPKMAAKFKQSGERHVPVFDSVIEQGLLASNVFAFSMAMRGELGSELTIGWIDETKYTGEIVWHDVVLQNFWSLALDKVTLSFSGGDKDEILMTICDKDGGKACLVTPDSGTSSMTFPSWAFHELEGALSATGANPKMPCPPSFELLTLT